MSKQEKLSDSEELTGSAIDDVAKGVVTLAEQAALLGEVV